MNHCVPDFEMEDDYAAPATTGFSRPKKPAAGEEEIMELLWQNGQVVVQSQNQRPPKKNNFGGGDAAEKEIRPTADEQQHLFMQEDEMASWLQYPLDESSFDRDLYADILYPAPPPPPPPPPPSLPAPTSTVTQTRPVAEIRHPPAPPRPPIPPAVTRPDNSPRLQNFVHFSRLPVRPRSTEPMSKPSVTTARESTVVESNETPAVDPRSRISHTAAESRPIMHVETGAGYMAAVGARDVTETSSPGGSGASFIASGEMRRPAAPAPSAVADRKRKARETDDNECQSEDTEFEITEASDQKKGRGSTSAKRSRAAEVHNLSERRRRDRINEKMRALQELIPRCNKSDKASMLDEAIEYLKSLQLQVQMMSMGCGMVPMMYPGMQQYMPAAMGLGMGMGMSMADMAAMNRPMVPYPAAMLAGSAIPPPQGAAASHLGPRFPMPAAAFHIPQVPGHDHSRIQATNQVDHPANPLVSQNPTQPRMPNFVDQYQQFLGLHPAQLSLPQNLATLQPSGANKPAGTSSRDAAHPNNQRGG